MCFPDRAIVGDMSLITDNEENNVQAFDRKYIYLQEHRSSLEIKFIEIYSTTNIY